MATLAWNGHRHVELAFAACGSGAILHALDPLAHPDRIVRIVDDVRVRIVFFDLSFMPLVEEIAPRLANVQRFIALTDRTNMPGPATIANMLCYEDAIAGAADDFDWPDFDDRTIAALSSMAGRAEEPDRARSALLPTVAAFVPDELNHLSQDIVLSAVPMSHVDGWRITCAAWQAGAKLVFPGPWLDGRSLHDLIESEGVTVAAAGGLVWRGLLAHAEREGATLSGLRLAIVTDDAAGAEATASTLSDHYGVKILRSPRATPHYGWGDAGERSPLVSRVNETASDTTGKNDDRLFVLWCDRPRHQPGDRLDARVGRLYPDHAGQDLPRPRQVASVRRLHPAVRGAHAMRRPDGGAGRAAGAAPAGAGNGRPGRLSRTSAAAKGTSPLRRDAPR